jgi:hypothetical protein
MRGYVRLGVVASKAKGFPDDVAARYGSACQGVGERLVGRTLRVCLSNRNDHVAHRALIEPILGSGRSDAPSGYQDEDHV